MTLPHKRFIGCKYHPFKIIRMVCLACRDAKLWSVALRCAQLKLLWPELGLPTTCRARSKQSLWSKQNCRRRVLRTVLEEAGNACRWTALCCNQPECGTGLGSGLTFVCLFYLIVLVFYCDCSFSGCFCTISCCERFSLRRFCCFPSLTPWSLTNHRKTHL